MSVVQQDPFLFTAAIDNNVNYGDPWAERSAIRRATEAAQLNKYVEQLPEGYETLVGERGVSLSGGQRQRLAIARSVLPTSSVIVFDDSTAAVDAATERQIHEALADVTRDRAIIVIAHRLSSVMYADEILFLDEGRIVERGAHDVLVALGGRYAALYAPPDPNERGRTGRGGGRGNGRGNGTTRDGRGACASGWTSGRTGECGRGAERMKAAAKAGPALRRPRAVVGSQVSFEEEMFGAAFDGRVVRRFWAFVIPYRRRVWIGVIAVLVFTLTQVAIPLVLRYAIDDALVAGDAGLEVLRLIVFAFFAVVGLNYASNFIQELVVGRIASSVLFDLRRAMYRHLQHVSLSFMDRTEVGRLMSRLQGDVNALQEFLETSIFAIGDFVLLVGIVAVLLFLDVELGLLTLSVVPVLIAVRIVWLPRARRAFLRARETSSIVNGALAENVHGIRTIQEMGREAVNFQLFDDKAKDNLNAHLRGSKFSSVMIPIVDTLTGIAMAVVIVVGGGMVLEQELELGVMVAFFFYVQRFFDPIRSLTIQYSIMQRAMAAGQRIFEVLDVPVDVRDRPDAAPLPRKARAIELDDVTFGYAPGHPVLRNVSFRVEPGETVALVGPTGSGKTSVTALVHRFYDVWSGEVRIGGHDVRDVRRSDLGAHVAMVLQEPFLFTGSVYDNIRYNQDAMPLGRKSRRRRARSAPTSSSDGSRRATTRCSTSAARTSPSASASS